MTMSPALGRDMKPMRKGTRSCRECRRRKIKCHWESASATVCKDCNQHNRNCVSQGYVANGDRNGKSGRHIQVKIERLAPIVERLAKQPQDHSTIDEVHSHVQDLDALDGQASESGPIYTLFNNEVLRQPDRSRGPHLNNTTTVSFGGRQLSDLEKLQSTIAHEPNILDVVEVSKDWWISWRDQAWVLRANGTPQSARSFVQSRFESQDPVTYATGLMCVAMALQHIRPAKDDITLKLTTNTTTTILLESIVAVVDQVILTKNQQNATVILVALQRAKIHAESSQLRKSWLRIRQALELAKELQYTNGSDTSQDEIMERQRWIGHIYEMDNSISMILGFPHATDSDFTDSLALSVLVRGEGDVNMKMRALRRVVALAAARINDRNGSNWTEASGLTDSIQRTLNLAASAMPLEWWNVDSITYSTQRKDTFEHLMAQVWFWQIQSFLHLPSMLDADRNPDHDISRDLCLQGCRNMLQVFCCLRGDPGLSIYMCSCEDFQAVLAACMLLVGVLCQISYRSGPYHHSFEDFFAVIEDVKDIFRYRSEQENASIATQGLKAIETLESFMIAETAVHQHPQRREIVLPYFGLIKVEARTVPAISQKTDGGAQVPVPLTGLESTDSFRTNWLDIDSSIDWDQFLRGEELTQDWESFSEVLYHV